MFVQIYNLSSRALQEQQLPTKVDENSQWWTRNNIVMNKPRYKPIIYKTKKNLKNRQITDYRLPI